MSAPLEFIIGITAASLIGVGSFVVVLDTTAKRVRDEAPKIECVQQNETVKCTPMNQEEKTTVTGLRNSPEVEKRVEKVEDTLDRIMTRLDRIEKKVEGKE